ncbi:ricin-type beta-trefoil lectin domain protein [Streptomyces cinnamoneus]|uniref:ricin-type beta-trefoil lectin domain protein n=1 Tax=Streptomyces cinnamoneus TaxID=53446 RepID=UPI003424DFDE
MRLPLPPPRATSRSGPRRSRLTAALTSTLLAVGMLVGAAPGPGGSTARADDRAAAPPNNGSLPFTTYNMQGSDNGLRWNGEVGPLTMHHEVVALQESGNGPPPAAHQRHGVGESIRIPGPFPAGLPDHVNHTVWRYRHHTRHVYFLQTDPQRDSTTGRDRWRGGRVNLAVVTHARADEVRIIENPLYNRDEPRNEYRYRRALGVRIGNTVYYNVHARGADVAPLLRRIRAATRAGENWVMTGDFNLDIRNRTDRQARESLHLRPDEQLARPHRSTHQRGGELDYAITRGTPRFNADIPAARGSDHYPVQFEPAPTPVPAAPDGPVHNFSSAFENARTGLALDVDNNGRVTTRLQAYNARQRFRVGTVRGHWYNLRGNSPRAASGALAGRSAVAAAEACPGVNPFYPMSPILMLSCESPQAQWHPEDPGAPGGPLRWHNSLYPNLCLTGTKNEQPVVAFPCSDVREQQWWDTSRAVPERAWEDSEERVRLRAWNGLYLDNFSGGGADGTPLTTRRRNEVSSQRWDIQYAGSGDSLVRIKGRDGGRCIDIVDSVQPHSGERSVLHDCTGRGSKTDGTGHRWQAEMYGDGTLRFRNEAAHLCLVPSARETGYATIQTCSDDARQRWTIVP